MTMEADYRKTQRKSPHQGLTMKAMVARALGPTQPTIDAPSTLDTRESQRTYKITAWLNSKNWMGNIKTRVILPNDDKGADGSYATGNDRSRAIEKAQAARSAEFFRQSAMPWGNVYMHTPTDKQRENNVAHAAFVKQRQLSPPSTYGQFYAFMHALSAAFGNLNQK